MNRYALMGCAVALSLGVFGCGGDDDISTFVDGAPRPDADDTDAAPLPDGSGPDAGSGLYDASGVEDAPVSAAGPLVEVISPAENSSAFEAASIVTSPTFTATCSANTNPDTQIPVDPSAVTMTAIVGSKSQTVTARPTSTAGEFEADFDVTDFPNGTLVVRCTAQDFSSPPVKNSDENNNFLDLGPRIYVTSPVEDAYYKGKVSFLASLIESKVAAADTLATVGAVEACLSDIAVYQGTGDGPHSAADLYFDGQLYSGTYHECGSATTVTPPLWAQPLNGQVSIYVYATNARGVTRTVRVDFVADSSGPTIEIETPSPGELVGGFVTVVASVTDPAGVSMVRGWFGHGDELNSFPMYSATGNTYVGTYDTRNVDPNWIFPTLEVTASDSVGNENSVGELVALDSRPPLIGLDPPPMREGDKIDSLRCLRTVETADSAGCTTCLATTECVNSVGNVACTDDPDPDDPLGACQTYLLDHPAELEQCAQCLDASHCLDCMECGRLFDPLGSDAASDGQVAGSLSEIRARVEDQRNGPEQLNGDWYVPIATVDPGSVQLFVLQNDAEPLLQPSDSGDSGSACTINPGLTLTTGSLSASDQVLVIDLVPVEPGGSSYFPSTGPRSGCPFGASWDASCIFDDANRAITDSDCVDPMLYINGESLPLCVTTPLSRAISTEFGELPALYGIPQLNDISCLGNAFDFRAAGMEEGWACAVAVAQDTLGNWAVSPPLRVCFDDSGSVCGAAPGQPATLADMPTCGQDTCALDSFFDHPAAQMRPLPTGTTQCSDGIDNDGDDLVDYPSDPQCTSPTDDSE